MASVSDYQFNIEGNFIAVMDGMAESASRFNAAVEASALGLSEWEQRFVLISDYIDRANRSLQEFLTGCISLNSQMQDLSAIAGGTGNTNLFGKENTNAARGLGQSTGEFGGLTTAITGATSAEEQAAISYAEGLARIKQRIEDMKISLFQLMGDFPLWISAISKMLVPIAELIPLFEAMWSGMKAIKNLQWASMWNGIRNGIYTVCQQMAVMNGELLTGQFVSNGFLVNITRATLAMLRFATVGVLQALKGLGSLVLSFVTGGAASATFASIASASFAAFRLSAVTAFRAVSVAIMNIPIVGWIAAAIAALAALGIYFWNTSVKFRAVLKGLGAAFVATFKGIWELAKNVFGSIGDLIGAAFSFDGNGIKEAIKRMRGSFSEFGGSIGAAFNDAYQTEMAADKNAEEAPKKDNPAPNVDTFTGGIPTVISPDPTGGSLMVAETAGGDSNGRIRNITVNVDRLVERFEIHTTNLTEDLDKVKDMVSDVLLSALNDAKMAI